MMDDADLAALLGDAPPAADPAFRYDVFAHVAERKRRRAAIRRAGAYVGASALVGLAVPAAQTVGLRVAELWPVVLVAGVLGLAYVLAIAAAEGPGAAWARSRALLRTRL